ncbi:MAG: deiodinase-like protein [Planctomycetota bacterium]|jgi:hypothetical protein
MSAGIRQIHQRFADRFHFLGVYIREAHPKNGWDWEGWSQFDDPTTLAERMAAARSFLETAQYPFPLVVDRMDDAACKGYGAWPERLYVVAQDGTVAYQGGQGPRDVHLSRSIPTYTWEGAPEMELSPPLDEFLESFPG